MTASSGPINWRGLVAILSAIVRGDWTAFNHTHTSVAQGGTLTPAALISNDWESLVHDGSLYTPARRFAMCATNVNMANILPTGSRFYAMWRPIPKGATTIKSVGFEVATSASDLGKVTIFSESNGWLDTQLYETSGLTMLTGSPAFAEETGLSVDVTGRRGVWLVFVSKFGTGTVKGPTVNAQPHVFGKDTVGSASLSCPYWDAAYGDDISSPPPPDAFYSGTLPGAFVTFA